MRRAADGAMRGLARLLIRIFFRRIEVDGLGNLPVDGPSVLVANHINGLVDALLLMAALPPLPPLSREVDAVSDPAALAVSQTCRGRTRVPGQGRGVDSPK